MPSKNQTSGQWRTVSQTQKLTFLAAEDVRSGFTDSAFSLLEDLDLLLFSFSAESGESQEGLELLLFLKESGERGLGLALCGAVLAGRMAALDSSRADVLVPFSSFLRLASTLISRSLTAWS